MRSAHLRPTEAALSIVSIDGIVGSVQFLVLQDQEDPTAPKNTSFGYSRQKLKGFKGAFLRRPMSGVQKVCILIVNMY